jgi:hypothetical protein
MKTKTMAVSLALTFFSCSLFAQSQNDTVPPTTPNTDTIPRTDTAKTDAKSASAFIDAKNLKSVSESKSVVGDAIVYTTFPAKEREETISGK